MALSYADELQGTPDQQLQKAAAWLLATQQSTGMVGMDDLRAPIEQGQIMATADASLSFSEAFKQTGDARYKEAADRALAWIAAAKPEITQDEVFKILALSRSAAPEQRRLLSEIVEQLQSEQGTDDGWKETPGMGGANAFATGEVLYAFKQAGVSVNSSAFIRGVRFLLRRQREDGAWPSENTQSTMNSVFAPTMWAVIGLAGSFGQIRTGELQITTVTRHNPATRKNVEIILDLSGSMKLPLGSSTRIGTARQVLREVLAKLPDDFNVGLRFYGNRFSSRSKETCTDTQLVVPIQKIDRNQILNLVDAVKPRGETPLVYSILQTPGTFRPWVAAP